MSGRSLGPLDRRQTTTLTFDCYGTLVDWERGALTALRGQLPADAKVTDDALIRAFLEVDARLAGEGLFPYAEVLERFGVANDAQPARAIFAQALEALGTPGENIIHVAEGLCEAEPARALGIGSL